MHTYPDEVKKFIEENVKGITSAELTERVNKQFGTTYGANHIRAYMKNHGLKNELNTTFKKGQEAHNKGKKGEYASGCEKSWFKKGQMPSNHKPIGSERVDSKDGYILIKTAEPRTWRHKHRVIWEKHNGPIPNGCVVIFLDGDKSNLDINNLGLISRSELKIMNINGLIYDNAEVTRAGIMIAKVIDTKNKRRKKK